MLFNSFAFGFFLLFSCSLYWLVFNRNKAVRNTFLLVASYFFYACWDWRFLFLIIAVTVTDYIFGLLIHSTESPVKRKWFLASALIINLGFLFYFKYFNFFITSLNSVLGLAGVADKFSTLNIILPVGISFFTFQGLGYVIDIYRRQFEPVRDVVAFSTFIAFFPQLVAGPIERAKDLLPQFLDNDRKQYVYEKMRKGLLLIAVGLFKKMVIADRLAVYVDAVYLNPVKGLPVLMATVFFCFQLYLDFSAYSQIAVGTAHLFGFSLSTNFRRPYVSVTFKDFWSRWHITLTSWFRDYLYIPLGGNRRGLAIALLNTLIVFVVSGIWHGASWNFVIWGAVNGLALIVFDKWLKLKPASFLQRLFSSLFVTSYWALSLIFFRAPTFRTAILMFSDLGFGNADALYSFGLPEPEFLFVIGILAGLMIIELMEERWKEKLESFFFNSFWLVRWIPYIAIVLGAIFFGIYGNGSDNNFIYFQF